MTIKLSDLPAPTYKERGDQHEKLLNNLEDSSPDFTREMVQKLAAQQAQLQEMMEKQNEEIARLRQDNDHLQVELDGAKDRKVNALQFHQAPSMTEDQRWRAMHSEGGLLG